MRKSWAVLAYFLVFLCIAYSAIKIVNGESAIQGANLTLFALAIFSYIASIALWAIAWGKFSSVPFSEAIYLSFASTSGAVTPGGIGSDALRAYFSRRGRKGMLSIAASSIAVKMQKIALIALSCFVFVFFFRDVSNPVSLFSVAGASIALAVYSVFLFAFEKTGKMLVRAFGKRAALGVFAFEKFSSYLSLFKLDVAALLVESSAFEFLSLFLCFLSFGASLSFQFALAVFYALYFATKVPFLHGFGLVEVVGVMLLSNSIETPILVSALLAFDFCRLWFPSLLSIPFVILQKKHTRK